MCHIEKKATIEINANSYSIVECIVATNYNCQAAIYYLYILRPAHLEYHSYIYEIIYGPFVLRLSMIADLYDSCNVCVGRLFKEGEIW